MQFPDRTEAIEIHRNAARTRRAQGDHVGARAAYFSWVESVRQQNVNSCGQLNHELENAKQEYSNFVKEDPLYQQIRDCALKTIRETLGVLQTDLYTSLAQFSKTDIQYALYFAEHHGAIVRTKKGRSYSLSLP